MSRPLKLVYFAWVRERIGLAEEDIALPLEVHTVQDLLLWLQSRSEGHAHALQHSEVIRVALDRTHAHHSEAIGGASEIALFPPMTGG